MESHAQVQYGELQDKIQSHKEEIMKLNEELAQKNIALELLKEELKSLQVK